MMSDSLFAGARGNPEEATPGAASVLAPDPPYLWRGPLAVAVDEGQGLLVVLLHGFPELPGSWHNQVGLLVEAGYRVVVPYLRGYGYSPILADPAFSAADRFASDIVGERDLALAIVPPEFMTPRYVTDLRTYQLISGVGHWVQQEASEATTDALLAFLRGLDAR